MRRNDHAPGAGYRVTAGASFSNVCHPRPRMADSFPGATRRGFLPFGLCQPTATWLTQARAIARPAASA
jgi:hypothetical protein